MKVISMTLLTAAAAWSAALASGPVVVARIRHVELSDGLMVLAAQATASKVLKSAGVQLLWDRCKPGAATIEIEMDAEAGPGFHPRALAYAMPFAIGPGARIHIFRDRIQNPPWLPSGTILAYVLAHEIVHVLEGFDAHSDVGVMKAHWNYADYNAMRDNRLEFSAEDRESIHRGRFVSGWR